LGFLTHNAYTREVLLTVKPTYSAFGVVAIQILLASLEG
jgi:hypothetical protein